MSVSSAIHFSLCSRQHTHAPLHTLRCAVCVRVCVRVCACVCVCVTRRILQIGAREKQIRQREYNNAPFRTYHVISCHIMSYPLCAVQRAHTVGELSIIEWLVGAHPLCMSALDVRLQTDNVDAVRNTEDLTEKHTSATANNHSLCCVHRPVRMQGSACPAECCATQRMLASRPVHLCGCVSHSVNAKSQGKVIRTIE